MDGKIITNTDYKWDHKAIKALAKEALKQQRTEEKYFGIEDNSTWRNHNSRK